MKKKTKKKIKEALAKIKTEAIGMDGYHPKLYGEAKVVSYENKGLVDTFCMTAEWPSGEGWDFSFETAKDASKRISLHTDELDAMLACLLHLDYFNVE